MGLFAQLLDFIPHGGKFEKISGKYVATRESTIGQPGRPKEAHHAMSWDTNTQQALQAFKNGDNKVAFLCFGNAMDADGSARHTQAKNLHKVRTEISRIGKQHSRYRGALLFLRIYSKLGERLIPPCIPRKKCGIKTIFREVPLIGPFLALLVSTGLYLWISFLVGAPLWLWWRITKRVLVAETISLFVPVLGPIAAIRLQPDSYAHKELKLWETFRMVLDQGESGSSGYFNLYLSKLFTPGFQNKRELIKEAVVYNVSFLEKATPRRHKSTSHSESSV